jgi:hypothetical protein
VLFGRDPPRDLNLLARDGDARDGCAAVLGQVACGAAEAAADVEDGSVGDGDGGDAEQVVDEVDLGGFFGCDGWCEEAVVDVLAPAVGGVLGRWWGQ